MHEPLERLAVAYPSRTPATTDCTLLASEHHQERLHKDLHSRQKNPFQLVLVQCSFACRATACEVAAQMAASALDEERELAIHPIVATSVQHNTQVRFSQSLQRWIC